MTCDRFLLCNSLQLAATRQPLLFPPLSLLFLRLLSFLLSRLIFVARRCINHVHRYAIADDVLGTFCRRSIDSVDSIERPEKGLWGPIKTTLRLTAAAEGPRERDLTSAKHALYTETLVTYDMKDPLLFSIASNHVHYQIEKN